MSSKYTEAFDSLGSDDDVKSERIRRILSAQSESEEQTVINNGSSTAVKAKIGKRGIALLTALAVTVSAFAVFLSVWFNRGGLLNALSKLKDTYVNMDGVAAFGVWNAPDSSSETAYVSDVSYVKDASPVKTASFASHNESDGGVISGDWSDEERFDWESDYDWDPTKANVLIAINDDGSIDEVVYERTNGRGQVRQDTLGNAAAVYVSDSFTYVMYVSDREWKFWKDINFAQESVIFNGFHCHHEEMQTVVIHNATGKVFALKDIIPQVNELSGAINYTMQVHPRKEDYLYLCPMYGNGIPQWYNVVYDEQEQKIRYELMLPVDCEAFKNYYWNYYVRAARCDKYGQNYLLESHNTYEDPRITAGTVNLSQFRLYGKSLVFTEQNGVMYGTDGRAYAFNGGKLKVFGENFELSPVEVGLEVAFEGIANEFFYSGRANNEGIAYKLSGGYLYSMFGEVWKVDDDGTMQPRESLKGSFPRYADNGFLLNGEIIAFVDTQLTNNGKDCINGRMVHIRFGSSDGVPEVAITHIIDASEIIVLNKRMTVEQNENPMTIDRGKTRYFLITVQNGKPVVDYIADGKDGGVTTLTKPITEPLKLN